MNRSFFIYEDENVKIFMEIKTTVDENNKSTQSSIIGNERNEDINGATCQSIKIERSVKKKNKEEIRRGIKIQKKIDLISDGNFVITKSRKAFLKPQFNILD